MKKVGKKLYYKIGEVCKICGVEAHVLRYWESEFPTLSPAKNRARQRIYRQEDLELVQTIQRLLHEEGYTISGARRKLSEAKRGSGLPLFDDSERIRRKKAVSEIREDLKFIFEILDGDG